MCVGTWPALAQTTETPEVNLDVQIGKASPNGQFINMGYTFTSFQSYGAYLARPVAEFTLLHHSFGGGGYTDKVFMGGVAFSKTNPSGKVAPFGEVLGGVISCCGDTSFGIRYGGGLRYAYSPKIDFRVRFSLITGFYDGLVDTGWGIGGGIVWKLSE
jgi:hypothetical protein